MSEPTIRPISPDEVTSFLAAVRRGFGQRSTSSVSDPYAHEAFLATTELERTYALHTGEVIIATGASRTFSVAVPGSVLPMGGLTMVTVAPEHQRQGYMSRIVGTHLHDAIHREEAASVLWSSEPGLYRKFGYGMASEHVSMDFDARVVRHPQIKAEGIDIDAVTANQALATFPGIYETALRQTPGMSTRSLDWWRFRILRDDPFSSLHWSDRRLVLATRERVPAGYLIYRQKPVWDGIVNEGRLEATELVANDPGALLRLHRFASSITLFPHVSHPNRPMDDPLTLVVPDQRRMNRRIRDGLHLRPLDVPRLMTQRAYASSGSFVLQIHDEGIGVARGTYRLEVSSEGADCVRTRDEPTIVMDVSSLGSIYLGGIAASRLMRAGLVEGSEQVLRELDMTMSPRRMPWSAEVF